MVWWGWLVVALAAAALLTALGALMLPRLQRRLAQNTLARRVTALPLKSKLSLMWRLFRDRRVPWWSKALLPALAFYLALPLDLIPDFIPVIGYLDDLLLILLVAYVLLRTTPRGVIEEHLDALERGV